MDFGLVQAILESHGLDRAGAGRVAEAGARFVDQVLLGSEQAALVTALLRRAGVATLRVDPTLADPGGDGGEEPARNWRRGALELGMRLPRPGHGDPRVLQRERLAAPGRLALHAGPVPACGALGMLTLEADPLAAAAVLAGGEFVPGEPRVLGVELAGALPPGVGGVDLALALLARGDAPDALPAVLELGGEGVAALPMAERMSAAWLLGEAGRLALFPSDEATRAELAAQGREQDWRRVEAVRGDAPADRAIGLEALEPMLAPLEDLAGARPARALEGTAIERVLVGPAATFADLARFAARLAGRRVQAGTECTVVAGSRAVLDALAASGLARELEACGVRVTEGAPALLAAGSGTGLCFGVPHAAVATVRARWLVTGVECCAAAALAGAVAAPEGGPAPVAPTPAGSPAMDPWQLAAEGVRRGASPGPPPRAAAAGRRGPSRGEVLAVLGDEVECAALLGPGARVQGLRGRLRPLAGQLLAGSDAGFAARARERGGGFVVAGSGFGRGEPRAAVAVCLAETSVRAVLARSYAPGATPALVNAGVLPLRWEPEGVTMPFERGDELELTGLPEALLPGQPLMLRNLTRGTHVTVRHDLASPDIAVLRAGGLLSFVVGGHAAGRR